MNLTLESFDLSKYELCSAILKSQNLQDQRFTLHQVAKDIEIRKLEFELSVQLLNMSANLINSSCVSNPEKNGIN